MKLFSEEVRKEVNCLTKPRDEADADDAIRTEAAQSLRDLIGSITVHLTEEDRPVLDLEASISKLIDFAGTTNAPVQGAGGVRLIWLRGRDLTAAELASN